MSIHKNLDLVTERIAGAAERSGRSPDSVQLVCVTKAVGIEEIREAVEWGATRIGENKVQVAQEKRSLLADLPVGWDMIGHLQTNKINAALEIFDFYHSVDTLKLAEGLGMRARRKGGSVPALLEVNIFGEAGKWGLSVEELELQIGQICAVEGIDVRGLMTMAPWYEDPEETRWGFAALRELGEKLRAQGIPGFTFEDLSMGMTNDFEVAVEEGATLVRIGSAIFNDEAE